MHQVKLGLPLTSVDAHVCFVEMRNVHNCPCKDLKYVVNKLIYKFQ